MTVKLLLKNVIMLVTSRWIVITNLQPRYIISFIRVSPLRHRKLSFQVRVAEESEYVLSP